jgi:hypothetical protein
MGTALVSGSWVFPEKLFSAVKFGGQKSDSDDSPQQ